jgi:hypothetical protein
MIVNGTDLYVWISTELVAYSTSYTLSVEQETRPGTNKGSGIWRKALPGMLNITGSVDGLYVFAGSYATLLARVMSRTPVRLYFGQKDSVSGLLDTTTEFMSGDFLITSLEITASDAENATYSASFTYYDSFGTVSGLTPPTVVTGRAIGATTTTVGLNGNVTSDGGSVVTDRGFVWNINGNPTLADSSFSDGTGTGTYSEVITGLTPGTPYFYRAYATNAAGTSYGTQATFTTVAEAVPSYFWIAPNGSDTTGDGEFNTPWLTLAYAISQVTTGNTINLKVGTYNLTTQVVLPVGISLRGQGASTIISSTYVGGLTMGVLQLSSPTEGISGNQSISYLKFDGNVTGNVGIVVYRRSDVIIHHVTVEDFVQEGIKYHGGSGSSDEPTIYATGNEIHNCTFNTTDDGHGAIHLNGQDGIKIYDNTFTGVQRTLGHDMNHIDMVEGYNKNIEIYDNTFTLPELLYAANGTDLLYNFHIESWDGMGGNKLYNNTFNGGHVGIDVGGHFNVKGASTFAWQIYGNTFQWSANRAYDDYGSFGGVLIEGGNEYIYVFNNHFKNIPVGINGSIIQENLIHEYIYIYHNIFENIGFSSSGYNFALRINQGHATAITRYVYIYNNVIEGDGYCRMGIALESTGAMSYVEIRNNVIKDIVTYGAIGYWDDAGTIDNITITNNCLYNNNAERFYRNGKVVTNETYDGTNITGDPLFVSATDFHLLFGSPCIDAGIDVGLTTDYEGNAVSDPPEIGAYEFV